MLVSEVGLPTRTQAPVQRQAPAVEAPAPVATPDANVPATDVATTRADIQIRLAFEFGVRLSFDSNSAPVGRSDREGIEAYEDDNNEQDDDRVAKLAKGMTKALGRAIKEGLGAIFGNEDELSKADREALKGLEHELKSALKDAYKSNLDDGEMDLLGFATDALSAVQSFAQSFGDFYGGAFAGGEAAVDSGAATSGALGGAGSSTPNRSPDVVELPAPFVGVKDTPVLVSRVDPAAPSAAAPSTAALPTDPEDRIGDFGRFGGLSSFGSSQARFDRVSSLLERVTAQLQDLVDSLQPKEDPTDPAAPTVPSASDPARGPVVSDPNVAAPSFQSQVEFTASFTFEASINLVA